MNGESDVPTREHWPEVTVYCRSCGHPILTFHYGTVRRTLISCLVCEAVRVFVPEPVPVLLHPEPAEAVEEAQRNHAR